MQRRAAIEARKGIRATSRLNELDYLLGVHDSYRMGGIRFKRTGSDAFWTTISEFAAPPMASLRELQSMQQCRLKKTITSTVTSITAG